MARRTATLKMNTPRRNRVNHGTNTRKCVMTCNDAFAGEEKGRVSTSNIQVRRFLRALFGGWCLQVEDLREV